MNIKMPGLDQAFHQPSIDDKLLAIKKPPGIHYHIHLKNCTTGRVQRYE